MTARRRLGRVDFEPLGFVRAVQGLVDRFVAVPGASALAPAWMHPHLLFIASEGA